MKRYNIIPLTLIAVCMLVLGACTGNQPTDSGSVNTNDDGVTLDTLAPPTLPASSTPTPFAIDPLSNTLLFQAYLTPSDMYLTRPGHEPEYLSAGQVLRGIPWSPDRTKYLFNDSPSYRETNLPPYLSVYDLVNAQITQVNLTSRPRSIFWSPDGNYLFYGVGTLLDPPAGFYVYDFRTNENRLLTGVYQESEYIFGLEGWSADSQKFAFITKLNGQIDIYTVDITNSQIQQITDTPEIELWAVWSPVRDELLYGALSTSDELQLIAASGHYFYADALHLVTGSGQPLPFPLSNADRALRPDWMADGRQLAFSMNGQLCILEIETEALTCPLEHKPAVENLAVREPVWSADGAWIAFRAQERNELM